MQMPWSVRGIARECYCSIVSIDLDFLMTVVVKNKKQLVVPTSVSRRAGIKPGDRLEFKASGGIINIISILPSADDEYTPTQRQVIDAQLRQAAKGPYYGPFQTADSAIKFLRHEIRKRKADKNKTTRR
jgi:bifunctional DNA-binding transcriptional regulator/antitoxin component of YhaV-PrlF toxin-antitoxin module